MLHGLIGPRNDHYMLYSLRAAVNFINCLTPYAKLFAFYAQLLRSFLLAQKFWSKDSLEPKTVNEINPWSLKRGRQIITRNESAEKVKIDLAFLSIPRKMFYL